MPVVALGRPAVVAAKEGRATEETPLRAEPENGAETLARIPAGTRLAIEGRAEDGYYPVVYDGLDGWVATGSVATGSGGPGDPGRGQAAERERTGGRRSGSGAAVAVEDVNLRDDPSPRGEVLLVIPAGADVRLTGGAKDGFVGVGYDGAEGWVSGEYLRSNGSRARAGRAAKAPAEYREAEIVRLIEEAADFYGQPRADMLRVARCESELSPTAVNQRTGDSGLFQFNPGTWRSTPYADEDIFDPRASAYAAGWMWSVGRRNEWVCQ